MKGRQKVLGRDQLSVEETEPQKESRRALPREQKKDVLKEAR
jgi:predicted subunit of tRNA(5-methylaminomethyl-2-thiouridylate) methyltransferase